MPSASATRLRVVRPAAKAVQGIAPNVIAALHRNFLDRIGHIFNGDLDEAVRDFFGFATADLLRQIGEGVSYRMGIERKVCEAPKIFGKNSGISFPTITLASVTANSASRR